MPSSGRSLSYRTPGRSRPARASCGRSTWTASRCRASTRRPGGSSAPRVSAKFPPTSRERPERYGSWTDVTGAVQGACSTSTPPEAEASIWTRRSRSRISSPRQRTGVGSLQTAARCGLAATGQSAWVATNIPPGLVRVDYDRASARSSVVKAIPLAHAPSAIAVGAGSVWAVDGEQDVVRRIDPDSGKVLRIIRAGNAPRRHHGRRRCGLGGQR